MTDATSPMESVLIDGIAYQTPAPVAAELLRLHIDARQPAPRQEAQEPVSSAAKGAIMGAAYDFRDAHISGSMNLKRSAHAALEAAVDHALTAPQPSPAAQAASVQEDAAQRKSHAD